MLRCGDPGLLSHQSAAHLHGLIAVAPAKVHVTIPASRRVAVPEGVVLHRTRRRLVAANNNPSCTCVVDTVLDLADECSSAAQLVALVTRTLQRRDVSRASLIAGLGDRQRVRWRVLLRDLLGVSAQGIESVLEWRFDRDVIKAHGLPTPVRQDVARSGAATYRRDGVFAAYGLVVELDGRLGHTGDGVFRDMRRDNAAVRRGEVVLRFGWTDVVGRACDVAVETVAVLRQRGWGGRPRRCSAECAVR